MKNLLSFALSILLFATSAYAQRGRVIDANNQPIVQVVVALNDADSTFVKGATTDADGWFDLSSDVRPYILVFKHLSYESRTIRSSQVDLGNVTLKEGQYKLDEVVVQAVEMEEHGSHKTYRFTQKTLGKHVNLLHAMREIPHLDVFANRLSYMGSGSVKVLLNGVNATDTELATLSAEDVVKIELYDPPPARFMGQGFSCVVDIITKRGLTGGTVGINLFDAFHPPFGENSVGVTYNHKDSRWSLNYDNEFKRYKKTRLWEKLDYSFGDEEYNKTKEGLDSPFKRDNNAFQLRYMHRKDNHTFSVTGGFTAWAQTKDNAQNVTYSDGREFAAQNHEGERYKRYTLDLYYDRKLNEKNSLLLNVIGTYYDSRLTSGYTETNHGTESAYFSTNSAVRARKPSVIADASYTHTLAKIGTLSLGVRDHLQYNSQDVATNTNAPYAISTWSNETHVYGQLSGWMWHNKVYYRGMMGLHHSYFKREGFKTVSTPYFSPLLQLYYYPAKGLRLFSSYQLSTTLPSISMLSEVPVWIDNKYAFQGNPALHSYQTHTVWAGMDYSNNQISAALTLMYARSPDAILPFFEEGDDAIFQTYANTLRNEQYVASLSGTYYPFPSKVLAISLRAWAYRYIVKGNGYDWGYNAARAIPSLRLNLDKFNAELFFQSRFKMINGQMLVHSPSAIYAEANYKAAKGLSVGIHWRYPFYRVYEDGRETHPSALVQSVTKSYIYDLPNLVCFRLVYNFSFGRKDQDSRKKVNNADTDSGILMND
ncbi:MAG: TonB-dependent receptor [Mediterranea sp.]|jgi:hypothetical protein|nr:TonB-dependent receptor [Mediterranea sp.]